MKILVTRRAKIISIHKPEKISINWQGKILTCPRCNCQFQLESCDEPRILVRTEEVDGGTAGLNDFNTYVVLCPEGCNEFVVIPRK